MPMNDKVLKEIDNFVFTLSAVNDLHQPNDERRLYNIALEAVRADAGVPRDEMRAAFEEALKAQNLNQDIFEKFYPKYINVLERAFDILRRIHEKQPFMDNFRF